jgi:predicted TIM-barrel fold metal-dependent hydrolase
MGILAHSVDDAIGYWVQETAELHNHPNIYVKVSSVPSYSTHPYPYSNLNKYIRDLVDKMGPERCFWGTDLTRLMETKSLNYKQTIEHFTKHMGFSQRELTSIMGEGICKCLDWTIPAAATAA